MTSGNPPLAAKKAGTTLRLRPDVDLVASTVETQRGVMAKALEGNWSGVVLDLAAVEQLD